MSAGVAHLRRLGRRSYGPVFAAQRCFTERRSAETPDELWLVEHEPVFTQGQAGRPEHLLDTGDIPVVQSDRGGQVTYHGPGQVVLYLLADLRRLGLGVRGAVTALEQTVVSVLDEAGVTAAADPAAPGVYVRGAKIAALGLRVRRGCSYHGLSFNADLDLAPFARINPCGHAGQPVTAAAALGLAGDVAHWGERLVRELTARLAYDGVFSQAHWPPALAVPDTDPS